MKRRYISAVVALRIIVKIARMPTMAVPAQNAAWVPDWFYRPNNKGGDKTMAEKEETLEFVEADQITVEVTDKRTGSVFRRELPIHYLENDNGLVLSGEGLDGAPSQLCFLSDAALDKLNDLFGKGPDRSRCGET